MLKNFNITCMLGSWVGLLHVM